MKAHWSERKDSDSIIIPNLNAKLDPLQHSNRAELRPPGEKSHFRPHVSAYGEFTGATKVEFTISQGMKTEPH
jgi:hypothetical protein